MSKNRHYYINWKTGELTFDGQSKLLEPKLIAVLKLLNEAQGELVTYDEIHQSVWPNIIVAPNALQRIIAELRRHFDDSAKSQSVIKTHPKRGYSLQVKLETYVSNVSRKKTAYCSNCTPKVLYVYFGVHFTFCLYILV